jgi:hypothetical protein
VAIRRTVFLRIFGVGHCENYAPSKATTALFAIHRAN